MRHRPAVVLVLLTVLAACGEGPTANTVVSVSEVSTSTGSSSPTVPPTSTTRPGPVSSLPFCRDLETLVAPEDWYRDTPVYVANEAPYEEVVTFAATLDGFQEVWFDRQHNGWLAAGFVDADAARYQELLEAEFPGVGVVAVDLPYTDRELAEVAKRIDAALPDDMSGLSYVTPRAHVEIWVGLLTPERITLVEDVVGDDPGCLEGQDPATTPLPGPQSEGGDGWTFLGVVDTGDMGRPGVIADVDALSARWHDLNFEGAPPEVDFDRQIVIVFPTAYSGSCPVTRFDELVVEGDLVYPIIPTITTDQACTADANPRTYLVAVDRDHLPPPPFQIDVQDSSALRITVDADLRQPGSVPGPGDVFDSTLPATRVVDVPGFIEPGFQWTGIFDLSCGIGYLGVINEVGWHIAEESSMPPEWESAVVDGLIDLEMLMTEGPAPTLTATAAGVDVLYLPGPKQGDPCV